MLASLFLPAQFLYSGPVPPLEDELVRCAAVLGNDMRAPLPRAPVVRASLGPSAAATAVPSKNNGSYLRPWYVLMLFIGG